MKRLVIGGAIAAIIAGSAGASFAAGDGGPSLNGNNDFGLCTAWQAHEDNGNGQPGPFADMVADYDEANGDGAWAAMCDALLNDGTPGNSTGDHTNNGGGHGKPGS